MLFTFSANYAIFRIDC